MFPVEAFQRTVEQFVSILQQFEIPFHIPGGSIRSAYGDPRLTQDIDTVVSPEIAKTRLRSIFRNCSPDQQASVREAACSLGLEQLLQIVLSESDDIR